LCSNFDQAFFSIFPALEEANLGSKIKLINSPSSDQLSLLYRAATVTILPSTMLETFGFVTLESLYFNTPVIAFDIGANPELIETKYLVKYSSKNHWQELISRLNDTEKQPIEKYSSPLIKSFSWSSYLNKMLAFANKSY
jgi:glycosyltransferase involved in cell wall biosynthesis